MCLKSPYLQGTGARRTRRESGDKETGGGDFDPPVPPHFQEDIIEF